jgi:hypothetical protein
MFILIEVIEHAEERSERHGKMSLLMKLVAGVKNTSFDWLMHLEEL